MYACIFIDYDIQIQSGITLFETVLECKKFIYYACLRYYIKNNTVNNEEYTNQLNDLFNLLDEEFTEENYRALYALIKKNYKIDSYINLITKETISQDKRMIKNFGNVVK